MADEIKRWAVEPLRRARPGIDERLFVALPWLGRRLVSAIVRARAGSRLRRAVLTHWIRVGAAANNRRDYAALSVGLAPDVELYVYPDEPEFLPAGQDAVHYGREGYLKALEIWKAPFSEHRWDLHELVDRGGDRFGARIEEVGRGGSSGAEVRWVEFQVWQFERGLLRRNWLVASEAAMLAVLEATHPVPIAGMPTET